MALLLRWPATCPGPRQPDRRALGALAVLGRRAARQDAGDPRLRAHRPARGPSRPGLRDARDRLRPFVAAERYRDLGVDKAESSDEVYAEADFLTLHLPKTPETEGWLDAEALAKCKDGVRAQRRARAADRRRGPRGRPGLRQGRRRGARRLPLRADHRAPLFGRPNVIVTRTSAPRRPRPPSAPASRPPSRSSPRSPAAWSPARSTSRRRGRGHGGAGALPALSRQLGRLAMAWGGVERRPRRGRAARAHRRARRARSRSRSCSACSPATPRRRSTPSTRPRSPRSAGSADRDARRRRATSPTSCA